MNEIIFINNVGGGKDILDWLNFFVQFLILICAGIALFNWKQKNKYELAIHTVWLIEKLKFQLKGDLYSLDSKKEKTKISKDFGKLCNFKFGEYDKVMIRAKSVFGNDKDLISLLEKIDNNVEVIMDTFGFLVFGIESRSRELLDKNEKKEHLEEIENNIRKIKKLLEDRYINKNILKLFS